MRRYGRDYRAQPPVRGYDRNLGYFRNRGGWNRNYAPHGYGIDYGYTRGGYMGSRDMSGGAWNVAGGPGGDLAQGGSAFGGGTGAAGPWGAGGGAYEAYGRGEMGVAFGRGRTPRQGYVGGRGIYDTLGGNRGLARGRPRYGGTEA